jgi:hypothetical protein
VSEQVRETNTLIKKKLRKTCVVSEQVRETSTLVPVLVYESNWLDVVKYGDVEGNNAEAAIKKKLSKT